MMKSQFAGNPFLFPNNKNTTLIFREEALHETSRMIKIGRILRNLRKTGIQGHVHSLEFLQFKGVSIEMFLI